jgi:hypothetical protein
MIELLITNAMLILVGFRATSRMGKGASAGLGSINQITAELIALSASPGRANSRSCNRSNMTSLPRKS